MQLPGAPVRARPARLMAIVILALIMLSSCAEDERREIRLTPTSTVETGVRILVDNCPGPERVSLSVRDNVLWEITQAASTDNAVPATDTGDIDAEALPDDFELTDALDAEPVPGLVEFLVGRTPEGWTATTALADPLEAGVRYTISTEPDGQTIDFSTPDLSAGLLWDGTGNAQFNPDLINVECSEPADVEGFARNIGLLLAFWVTAAATVMVAVILVLFVITRRFSRIRSLQKRAEREATAQRVSAP